MSKQPALIVMVKLTDAQRRQIREQTGHDIVALPYEAGASSLKCEFGGLTLRVARGVFVPAQATEQLLQVLLTAIEGHEQPIIIDVGTGSGAIALAAAVALPQATIIATDTSQDALRCARANRKRLRIPNVRFEEGSLLASVRTHYHGGVSAVVGNVPYLPPRLASALESSFPADTAIGLAEDGLGLPRQLASTARDFLVPGGSLVMQLAGFQWRSFAAELIALGYDEPMLTSTALDAPVSGRSIWRGQPPGV